MFFLVDAYRNLRYTQSMDTVKEIVSHFKQARIAQAVGVKQPTVSQAVKFGLFPAAWYLAIKNLCAEEGVEISDSVFRMKGKRK